MRVSEGYSDPAAINFELLDQTLESCGVARPTERVLFPITALSSPNPAGVTSLPLGQMVVLEARYPQAGLAVYQQVMARPAIAQFAPLVVVHAGGAEENSTVQRFNIFPTQDAAEHGKRLIGSVFAELYSPALDRQLTGRLIDFRWFATD